MLNRKAMSEAIITGSPEEMIQGQPKDNVAVFGCLNVIKDFKSQVIYTLREVKTPKNIELIYICTYLTRSVVISFATAIIRFQGQSCTPEPGVECSHQVRAIFNISG